MRHFIENWKNNISHHPDDRHLSVVLEHLQKFSGVWQKRTWISATFCCAQLSERNRENETEGLPGTGKALEMIALRKNNGEWLMAVEIEKKNSNDF